MVRTKLSPQRERSAKRAPTAEVRTTWSPTFTPHRRYGVTLSIPEGRQVRAIAQAVSHRLPTKAAQV
jgi:hypothetical protein